VANKRAVIKTSVGGVADPPGDGGKTKEKFPVCENAAYGFQPEMPEIFTPD
jgi:hypothetical protein